MPLPTLKYRTITKPIIVLALTILLLLNSTLIITSVALYIITPYIRLLTPQKQINVLSNQSERLISLISSPVYAATSYKLKFPNLNMTSGSPSTTATAPAEPLSTGFYVKAGFPYSKTIIPFTFTISNLSISLGHLTLSQFSSLANTLTVSLGSGGYQVTSAENHPLQLKNSLTNIPDTACNTACNETKAAAWDNPAKSGFGYNLSGNDIPTEFTGPTLFKQFADASIGEPPQIVMSSPNVNTSRVATVTYQVSINASQAAGDYENSITFTALPTY